MNDTVKIDSLSYSYLNKEPLLDNMSIQLIPGQITAILGPSGVGKSTLLRILMGIETGASGFIGFQNTKASLMSWTLKQTLFSIVPQIPHLLPWKTVGQNIELAMNPANPALNRKKTLELLNTIQLQTHIDSYPETLSLGQAARVSFARAIATNSHCILLDEPFAALDAVTRYLMQEWLVQYVKLANVAALLVTHDIQESLKTAQNIFVINGKPAKIVFTHQQNHLQKNLSEGETKQNIENKILEFLN